MATDTLTRAKYTGLDFDTISDDLRARLQVKFAADFNDFAVSSMGIVLLDTVAFGLDTLSFYLDQRATDSYLATARTRGSVAQLTRQLGYKMGPAVASSVDVEVSLKAVYGFDVTIYKGFKLKGPNDLVFETAQDVTFAASTPTTTKKLIPCYEGESISESFVSDGTANQIFRMRRVPDKKFIVSGTVKVVINAATWKEEEFLPFTAANHYEVGYNDDPPSLRFGSGNTGNIPPAGSVIAVSYVASRGKAGQAAKGTITKEVAPLVVNFQTIGLSINNPSGAIGGDDPESLEQAKAYAPKVFRTRKFAVTRSDYEALASAFADPLFGRVAVAQALTTKTSETDVELKNNIDSIRASVTTPSTSVTTLYDTVDTQLTAIGTNVVALQGAYTSALAKTDSANASADSALTQARSAKNKNLEIANDAGDIGAVVGATGSLRTFIAGLSNVNTNPTNLNNADKATIVAYMDTLKQEGESVASLSAEVGAAIASTISDLGGIKDNLADIGVGAPAATTQLGVINASTTAISSAKTSAATNALAMKTLVLDAYTSVETALSAIDAHFKYIYSSDCRTNVVTVPILTRDASGFYAAPSSGLIRALQDYLDGRKDVTQTVVVTSGAGYLVPAKLTVRVGVLPNFSQLVVGTAVSSAIDGLLRNRKFKQSLYASDVEQAVLRIQGVGFVNVTILGHLDTDGLTVLVTKLDGSGNLIAAEQDIITKGLVSVSVEAVTL